MLTDAKLIAVYKHLWTILDQISFNFLHEL